MSKIETLTEQFEIKDGIALSDQNKSYMKTETVEKQINEEEMSCTGYISTKEIDRDNDIILPNLIDTKEFNDNPIVCWMHNIWDKPIGKSAWPPVVDEYGMLAKTIFAKTIDGIETFQLIKEGMLNAFSIGFKRIDDPIYRDDGVRQFGKIKLIEYSVVTVPSNQSSLVQRNITQEFIKSLKSTKISDYYIKQYVFNNMESDLKAFQVEIDELKQIKDEIMNKSDINKYINETIDIKMKTFNEIVSELTKFVDNRKKEDVKSYIKKLTSDAIKSVQN